MDVDQRTVSDGRPYPLGPTWDGAGVNFAVFSAHATAIEICLFDEKGEKERARVRLPNYHHQVFYGYIEGISPGDLYGLRVYGPYQPTQGHRFNPNKLLIDPCARQLKGEIIWNDALFGYVIGEDDLSFDTRDSAPFIPKCVVTAPLPGSSLRRSSFRDQGASLTDRSLNEGLIYEAHTRGLTMRHPRVPEAHRGSFAGLASDAIIEHLSDLGVSALELLPIQSYVNDHYLFEKGLSNYWGYQPLSYFAPAPHYLKSGQLLELYAAVERLKTHEIEVLIDVVYNHTGEGNERGPTLSFRGIDNASYYSLKPEQPRYYLDDSGCGNRLNIAHPRVLQLVMDSLRYWHKEIGVSGFRFDLCTTLGRGPRGLDMKGPFFAASAQDPDLVTARLIAEPWDVGPGGYQLGSYLPRWSEWNDRYRDTLRRFWRGDQGLRPNVARRLCGSSALYRPKGRSSEASVNYLCSHDGATLHDLVTYAQKRNHANGEDNRDGHHDDLNINFGVDGEDDRLSPIRRRAQRSLLTSLFLSRGALMLLGGDEMGRTQRGNNNAYCQDNEISWFDWEGYIERDEGLFGFTQRLSALRREFKVLHASRWLTGERREGCDARDLIWLNTAGEEKAQDDWDSGDGLDLYYVLSDAESCLLVMMNASDEERRFKLPSQIDDQPLGRAKWALMIDSADTENTIKIGAKPKVSLSASSKALSARRAAVLLEAKTVKVWRLILS